MEKRALIRNRTRISVTCDSLTPSSRADAAQGIMLNCSITGTCIALNRLMLAGSIVMIKAAGRVTQAPCQDLPEGFRTLALAEVKWSKPMGEETRPVYAMGLKYLPN